MLHEIIIADFRLLTVPVSKRFVPVVASFEGLVLLLESSKLRSVSAPVHWHRNSMPCFTSLLEEFKRIIGFYYFPGFGCILTFFQAPGSPSGFREEPEEHEKARHFCRIVLNSTVGLQGIPPDVGMPTGTFCCLVGMLMLSVFWSNPTVRTICALRVLILQPSRIVRRFARRCFGAGGRPTIFIRK